MIGNSSIPILEAIYHYCRFIREIMNIKSFVWEIKDSPYPSNFLQKSRSFEGKNPIFLVDQYSGKRPMLLNDEFLSNRTITFKMRPCALLDSNIVDTIKKLVEEGKYDESLDSFFRFIRGSGWFPMLGFYYAEQHAKSNFKDFYHNTVSRTESLLRFCTMSEEHFLKSQKIVADPELLAYYTDSFSTSSITKMAKSSVDEYIQESKKWSLQSLIEATEIALMKMVLIRKVEMVKCPVVEQYEALLEFMCSGLRVMLKREAHLALHYFCDNAGKLLGVQSSTKAEKAYKMIRATAWDMFLLRMPEALFSQSLDDVCVTYVATHEKALRKLAELYTIDRISVNGTTISSELGFDLSNIPESAHANLPRTEFKSPIEEVKNIPVGLHSAVKNEFERFCA